VKDRDGSISIAPAGNYAVEAKNGKGDVELTLPANASATVNAHTHNGDILSEFATSATSGGNKTANFQIGSGGSKIVLNADNGDVRIKKGPSFSLATPHAAKAAAPNSPHLKARKALPSQPVTQ
jgi:DUF4097 and DUF4098 domain-containing protein YvlB